MITYYRRHDIDRRPTGHCCRPQGGRPRRRARRVRRARACTAPRPRRSPGGRGSRSRTSSGSSARRRSSTSPVVARCFRQTLEMIQRAAEGKRGEEALQAIGEAYGELLASDRLYLRGPDAGVRRLRGPRDLRRRPRRLRRPRHLRRARLGRRAGGDLARSSPSGMLMNVLASMEAPAEDWGRAARRGLQGGRAKRLFFSPGGK